MHNRKSRHRPCPKSWMWRLARGGCCKARWSIRKGAAMKAVPVSVSFDNQQVANTVSDESGRFSVDGLRGGVHQVSAGQGAGVYRLWTPEAAPPTARPGSVVIPGESRRARPERLPGPQHPAEPGAVGRHHVHGRSHHRLQCWHRSHAQQSVSGWNAASSLVLLAARPTQVRPGCLSLVDLPRGQSRVVAIY